MIYLITGQPGNGKTLYAMAAMHAEYERNAEAVKAGKEQPRDFFSNVAGATTEENPKAYPWVQRMPEHNDWTKLPKGSYVQYDEAHADGRTPGLERYGELFPATGKPGESQDPRVRAMSTHRHGGYDLVLITQYPNKIHHQVRTLVGQHVHMNRAMGLTTAGIFKWTRTQADPYDEDARDKAEEEIWQYPKGEYERYFSATLHTASYKFKIPKKVWSGLSMLIVAGLVAWGLYYFLIPKQVREKQAKPPQAEASLLAPAVAASDDEYSIPGTGMFVSLTAPKVTAVSGCVDTPRACRCFDTEGDLIDQSQAECRIIVDGPLPFNVLHQYSGGNAQVASRESGPVPEGTENASPGAVVTGGQTTGYGDHMIPGGSTPTPANPL